MFTVVIAGLIAFLLWYLLIKPLRYWSDRGVTQSKPWIFFGDSWKSAFRIISFCEWSQWVYNLNPKARYVGFYQFYSPTLAIRDPDLIKQITIKDFEYFTDHRTFADPESDPLWGKNLFALKGQKWKEMRNTLSASFTSSKMKNMHVLMVEAAQDFVKYFLNKNEDFIEIEMKDAYTRYTNDVIATTAFGIKVNSLEEPKNSFYTMGKQATSFFGIKNSLKFFGYFVVPKLFKYLKIGFFDPEASVFFRGIINETIKTREEKGIVRPDMLNLLLEARKGDAKHHEQNGIIETGFATVHESDLGKTKQIQNLTNDDICAQALIFFFAGFDTISTAMCFGSYELALNKDIQDRLRKEILETNDACEEKLTYEALLKMKYMDMVVSEILRKWPPAVAIDRVCTKNYTIEPVNPEEKPLHLKPGDYIWIPSQGIHRDPNYYPDPDKFDPERFSDENKNNIQPYTYLPFGIGPRNCIGSRFALLETKALLFYLLLHFEIVPCKKTVIPLRLNRKSFNHTAEDGFWFALKKVKS